MKKTAWNSTLKPGKPLRAKSRLKSSAPKFPFSDKTREIFEFCYCFGCDNTTCGADCLHHIFGRVSDSPFNAAPMNNNSCHINEGEKMGGHTRHMKPISQQKLLAKNMIYLSGSGYSPTKNDVDFLFMHASQDNLKLFQVAFRVTLYQPWN